MAKKKKEDNVIVGLGKDENKLLVQKSTPLSALWKSELTLSEFKILDTYLSRIDSHKPERRTVAFEKGELEQLLGVTKLNISELKPRMKHLMGQVIEVNDPTMPNGFQMVTLFEEANCMYDAASGLWTVKLECTQKAMKYFFNIEQLGYLRYKLRCITSIQSRYSYILFIYLEHNRFRKSWEVELEELKEILNCHSEPTYAQFKRFNDLILKKCRKELAEKTECKFTYEPVKQGRKVVAIRFTLETLPPLEIPDIDPNQISMFEENPDDPISFLAGACTPRGGDRCEFSREEMEQICTVLSSVPDSKLPVNVPVPGIQYRRYHYLMERYAAMNVAHTKAPIKNRFAYFLKLIKKDAGVE